jgi:hypothetical protein
MWQDTGGDRVGAVHPRRVDELYGLYQPGLYAGGAVLVLVATALGITSFSMLRRSQPAGVGVVPVTVSASSNSNRNRTSTQQQPPMVFMMAGAQPDQHPLSQAPSAPTVPVVQPVVSSPVADAGKQPAPAVVPIGQPAVAVEGTVIRPRDHMMQSLVPQTQGQVYTLQPQSQHPVQLQPQNGQLPLPQHAVLSPMSRWLLFRKGTNQKINRVLATKSLKKELIKSDLNWLFRPCYLTTPIPLQRLGVPLHQGRLVPPPEVILELQARGMLPANKPADALFVMLLVNLLIFFLSGILLMSDLVIRL